LPGRQPGGVRHSRGDGGFHHRVPRVGGAADRQLDPVRGLLLSRLRTGTDLRPIRSTLVRASLAGDFHWHARLPVDARREERLAAGATAGQNAETSGSALLPFGGRDLCRQLPADPVVRLPVRVRSGVAPAGVPVPIVCLTTSTGPPSRRESGPRGG